MPVSPRIAADRQRRHDERMAAAEAVVPKGLYCYTITAIDRAPDGAPIVRTSTCPFWKRNGKKPHQRNGYCRLLKAGDWMPHPRGTMLLWDRVKECSVNHEIDEGDYV